MPGAQQMREIFRQERERTLGNDWVVRHENHFYQVEAQSRSHAPAQSKVRVCEWADGAMEIRYRERKLNWHELAQRRVKPEVAVAAEALRPLADYAGAKNVVLNLENDDLASEDAFFIVKVIEAVNHPYLHALPDFCNSMLTGDEDFNYKAVAAMFAKAFGICHVKDSEVAEDKKVYRVDLKKTFAILKASGFRGYCSMEFEGQGDPYEGTEKLIKASLQELS